MATETIIFQDNFDTFDLAKWKHEITMGGGGNWEFEMYVNDRRNSFVKDGSLFLKPTLTADRLGVTALTTGNVDMYGSTPGDACTSEQWYGCFRSGSAANIINPIQSARIRTAESFSFKYGRVEVRAKLPKGDWIWPAIWMLPQQNAYGNWPLSGEVDIMESRGNGPSYLGAGGVHMGNDNYGATTHWGTGWDHNAYPLTHATYTLPGGATFADDFHTFGLYWSADELYMYVDKQDNVVMKVKDYGKTMTPFCTQGATGGYWKPTDWCPWTGANPWAPFDQEFFLIMNVAVGGTAGGTNGYFPDGVGGKPWTNTSPTTATDFWTNKAQWLSTWGYADGNTADTAAMEIDSVTVWGFPESTFTYRGDYKDQMKAPLPAININNSAGTPANDHDGASSSSVVVITSVVVLSLLIALFSYFVGHRNGSKKGAAARDTINTAGYTYTTIDA